MVQLAREHRLITVADNTFLSPYFQHPLDLGVNVVVHSTTKYLNGHSDMVGGAVITGRHYLAERLAPTTPSGGGNLAGNHQGLRRDRAPR